VKKNGDLQAAVDWRVAAGMSKKAARDGARAEVRRTKAQAELKALRAVAAGLKKQGY